MKANIFNLLQTISNLTFQGSIINWGMAENTETGKIFAAEENIELDGRYLYVYHNEKLDGIQEERLEGADYVVKVYGFSEGAYYFFKID